ncbi:MAG TPA: ATP-binding protein [Anaerolineae bacterium]|nr:ATP-binding protein [Anaerolineae bacterium]
MNRIGQSLGVKIFISYLVVIVVGGVSLMITAEFVAPTALARHMAGMEMMMGANMGMVTDLTESFRTAVNEVLLIATVIALIAAVVVSLFVTRRIITPIQSMQKASKNIAAGNYEERVLISSQDELGAFAHSFNQMAEALEQTEKRRRHLIGDVAHELRTPLSNIRTVMEGLIDDVLTPDMATFLNVQREVSRLQKLVYHLEELSRAEAGQIILERRLLPPTALIHAVVQRLQPQFDDKEITVHIDLPPNLPQVYIDPERITQVLLNLLGNALQYTRPGGRVTIRAKFQSNEIAIAVQDNGIGIAPEHVPHIFERFYRVDKSRSRVGGGSGIGLTISKHLVEAHGGRIWVESSQLGEGSIFVFTLPTQN